MELLTSQLYIKAFAAKLSLAYGILCTQTPDFYKPTSSISSSCNKQMKIFDWMQSKLTGKTLIKKPSSKVFYDDKVQKPPKEEVNEWPHGLLTIGTLGNGDLKEDQQSNPPPSPKNHPHGFTPEEIVMSLKKMAVASNRSGSVVLSRGKDVCLENTNTAIGKKSLSFLLKKVFVCRSGFAPAAAPGLRDPILESRMEKILKAILHKKIYPKNSSASTMSMKKYLENRHNIAKSANDEEINIDKEDEGSKWVKTDSEYFCQCGGVVLFCMPNLLSNKMFELHTWLCAVQQEWHFV
ncbi:hypothetical protein L3X38_039762 [Prunus dulcis]|uniref:Uncharacterized protein n=1 Tax=Prunus dulcis TaxID=3755 RepID=A0AAD4V7R4_PRUDU|nr:hypothetical protein L3X38_039762 [Prunus dulcis]